MITTAVTLVSMLSIFYDRYTNSFICTCIPPLAAAEEVYVHIVVLVLKY